MQDLGSLGIHGAVIVSVMVEEKGKQAEERQDEPRLWRPWRPPRRRRGWRVLWAVGMVVALLTTALLIVNLRPEIWKSLLEERNLTLIAIGVSLTVIIVLLAIGGASLGWTGFGDKTLWDWLQLLSALAIPVVLAAAGFWFTSQQDQRQQEIEDRRAKQAQEIENQRAEAERRLAEQRAQDEALQAYLDQMSSLLLEKDLRASEEDSDVRTLARARTIAVLDRLDPRRKITVLRFLDESHLIDKEHPVVSLADADFTEVHIDFEDLILHDVNLDGANIAGSVLKDVEFDGADMVRVNLQSTQLQNAFLIGVDLRYATLGSYQGIVTLTGPVAGGAEAGDLSGADLSDADLRGAQLVEVDMSPIQWRSPDPTFRDDQLTDLSGADLRSAILQEANLSHAILDGADLRESNWHQLHGR